MKNLLLFSGFLLFSGSICAQLTVKPVTSASGDSYIYVKDQIVFVKKEINLTKNPNQDVEASIYLRNGGQLIQDDPTALNSGNGFLSVQQNTKPTNAYAYYYWCSPVGEAAGAAGKTPFGLGNIYEDKNTVTGIGTNAIQSANIPQKEGFSSPLTISKRWMYIHHDPSTEAEGNYIRINANYAAPAGFGFTMKGVNEGTSVSNSANTTLDQTYEFRGRPNNGNFNIPVLGPVQDPNQPAMQNAMMTLTGNPYPSSLDLNKLYHDPDNKALSAIYYYDEDRTVMSHLYSQKPFGYGVWVPGPADPGGTNDGHYTAATFYIWNSGGTRVGSSGSSGAIISNKKRFAPIGQGFMFVGNNSSPADVYIKNEHRVYRKEGVANGSVFHRGAGETFDEVSLETGNRTASSTDPVLASDSDTRTPQLRLYAVFDQALTRDLLLIFSPEATDGYDRGFDGLSPLGMKSDIFFPIGPDSDRKPYVIQGINFHPRKYIPLTLKLHKRSEIEIRAVEEINKPYGKAYLFDRVENTYRLLQRTSSAASTFSLPAGLYENRFFIVFRQDSGRPSGDEDYVALQGRVAGDVDFYQNNPAQRLEVRNPERYKLKSASLYDMNGKLVLHETNLGDDANYSFYTGNLSDGVYLIKLVTSEDVSIDYKAVVVNK